MTQTSTPVGLGLSADTARRLYTQMVLIRRTEEALVDLYRRNMIPGFIHLGIGEEAVHVGVCDHLTATDHLSGTHRGHGQALAKGIDPARLVAEVLGRQDGVLGGVGGSLHAGDWSLGILPASPLVGGAIATMTGVALAHSLAADGAVAVCFFGDGAQNRGSFHEAINLASIWKLPMVYALIDNGWAISVPRPASTGGNYLDRARGYGVAGAMVDGKDLLACRTAAGEAIVRAREGGGPTLLVFDCPRGYGHEEGDAQPYRSKDDYAEARARDPLPLAEAAFTGAGLFQPGDVEAIEQQVAEQVREAIAFAEQSPLPDPSTAFQHIRPGQ